MQPRFSDAVIKSYAARIPSRLPWPCCRDPNIIIVFRGERRGRICLATVPCRAITFWSIWNTSSWPDPVFWVRGWCWAVVQSPDSVLRFVTFIIAPHFGYEWPKRGYRRHDNPNVHFNYGPLHNGKFIDYTWRVSAIPLTKRSASQDRITRRVEAWFALSENQFP